MSGADFNPLQADVAEQFRPEATDTGEADCYIEAFQRKPGHVRSSWLLQQIAPGEVRPGPSISDDGTGDQLAALQALLNGASGAVRLRAGGTYRIALPASGDALTIPAGKALTATGAAGVRGRARIVISHRVLTGEASAIALHGHMEGIEVLNELAGNTGSTPLNLVRWAGDGASVRACILDGGTAGSGGAVDRVVQGVSLNNSYDTTGLTMDNGQIRRCAFGFLKPNANASHQSYIRINGWDFTENYFEDLSLNSPNGSIRDVQASNIVIDNDRERPLPNDRLGISLASVSDAQFQNVICKIRDRYRSVAGDNFSSPLHIEEGCRNITFSGCRFLSIGVNSGSGSAVQILPNAVAGPMVAPRNIVFSACILERSGVEGGIGLNVYDVATAQSGQNILIAGMDVVGSWATGVYLGGQAGSAALSLRLHHVVSRGLIIDGEGGVSAAGAVGLRVRENQEGVDAVVKNYPFGVSLDRGVVGHITAENCTTRVAVAANAAGVIKRLTLQRARRAFASGAQNFYWTNFISKWSMKGDIHSRITHAVPSHGMATETRSAAVGARCSGAPEVAALVHGSGPCTSITYDWGVVDATSGGWLLSRLVLSAPVSEAFLELDLMGPVLVEP